MGSKGREPTWLTMFSGLRIPHLFIILEGLHGLIPGIIHSFKSDGGARDIAGFKNYAKSEAEILWAFRIIGVNGMMKGAANLLLVFLSTRSEAGERQAVGTSVFYQNVLRLFLAYQVISSLLLEAVPAYMGNSLRTVAPNAPGRFTPLVVIVSLTVALFLL